MSNGIGIVNDKDAGPQKFDFDYRKGLYRKNNFGQPCVWYAKANPALNAITLYHGIVGNSNYHIYHETIVTSNTYYELTSRFREKRKVGYKYLSELKDNAELPSFESLLTYLNTYLPDNRTTADGSLLAMLAKGYDNKNNKLFKKCSSYLAQYKVNGVRCLIRAIPTNIMFEPIRLTFQSREGTYWNSLVNLENYLLEAINPALLRSMVDEHYILDGELYLPGHTVNEINHFVKDPTCKENALIQFWCFDLAIESMPQITRLSTLQYHCFEDKVTFNSKYEHLNNKKRFVVLSDSYVFNDEQATRSRDNYIDLGFEGLILRNPYSEYQFGKRNMTMIKYKRATDGKFLILDIYPEGVKRNDIPLLLCKNDINDETFECHLSAPMGFQAQVLANKDKYIGKYVTMEFGERSGVTRVPFHVKGVKLIYDNC